MKTNQEIRDYIKTLRASDEGNEYAIIQYCLSQYKLKVAFREPNDSMPTVTFLQFKKWAERDFPIPNSIIVVEEGGFLNMISYVSSIHYDKITLGASFTQTGDLIIDKLSIPFDAKIRKATEKEIEKITVALSNRNFEWSYEYNRVIERFVPQICNYIRFKSNTGKRGIGVFQKTTKGGKVIMFCVKVENEPIQYSLNDCIGNYCDLKFFSATEAEKNIFKSELASVGKVWNGRLRRIEPIGFGKMKKGQTYYFINEKFNVVPAKESLSAQDRLKFNSGNYFLNPEEAEEAIKHIEDFRKTQLARPQKKIETDEGKDEGD